MSVVVITGAGGLIGSECVRKFSEEGYQIEGIDNNMRGTLFGKESSTLDQCFEFEKSVPGYRHNYADIRNLEDVEVSFKEYGRDISLVIHCAAQPSHDYAGMHPLQDFTINAVGTMNLLEATRKHCPEAPFIFCSSSKVYGDGMNTEGELIETSYRWIPSQSSIYRYGISEDMPLGSGMLSMYGVSKSSADIMVQEYAKYYGMKTVCFRGDCMTGSSHRPAELHGFLSYLLKCAKTGTKYRVFGYGGKQVRDIIHAQDFVQAFWHYFQDPKAGEVYNMGGSWKANCSILEAIEMAEELTEKKMNTEYVDLPRRGDHMWYISNINKFKAHYPKWDLTYCLADIAREILEPM